MDFVTKEKRSNIMRGVKSKNTLPEKTVRSILHKQGYRFRLHRKDLPGRPDICLPKYKTVIFVHGCFWHHHHCQKKRLPQSNKSYWLNKITNNVNRDSLRQKELKSLGWKVIVVWECEIKNLEDFTRNLEQKILLE